ncbi:beta-propeller fold lactonase family protein [Microbacterium sp. Mu-80]|uniref:Beta-propeller fold lactonase family protein n=1 Tax=Microbacterium bandirmense TaxID=3122050 RepID=A0ABU8LCS5_9MICO
MPPRRVAGRSDAGRQLLRRWARDRLRHRPGRPARGIRPRQGRRAARRPLRDRPGDRLGRIRSGGSAPEASRGRVSRAHSAVFLPDGRIATADLGLDLVRIRRRDLSVDHDVELPRGTGPRHMVMHPSGHLHVVTEYSCEVFTLASDREGRWGLASATTASPAAQVGIDFPAELAMSRDGATLYTALRGSNTIAALRVRGGGEGLEPLALADAGVDWPRHHLVYDGTLLVAGQRSSTISVVDLDERTGAPRDVRHVTAAPTPTRVLPA